MHIKIMTLNERRAEIVKILKFRGQERIAVLANETGASIRTVKGDIQELMKEYPIETARGNGGGVRLRMDNKTYKGVLTEAQQNALIEAMIVLSKPVAELIGEVLIAYGSFRNKAKIEVTLAERV